MRRSADHEPIIEALAPHPGEHVLVKHRYSAFQRSNLETLMRVRGRDQLLVTGVYAHIGCTATVVEAFQRDIEAFIAADAVADFSRADHDRGAALDRAHLWCADDHRSAAGGAVMAAMGEALDLERMRADVARVLGTPAEIGDDNLIDLDLDSMRMLGLVLAWGNTGLPLEFSQLAEHTTLRQWWGVVQQLQGAERMNTAALARRWR